MVRVLNAEECPYRELRFCKVLGIDFPSLCYQRASILPLLSNCGVAWWVAEINHPKYETLLPLIEGRREWISRPEAESMGSWRWRKWHVPCAVSEGKGGGLPCVLIVLSTIETTNRVCNNKHMQEWLKHHRRRLWLEQRWSRWNTTTTVFVSLVKCVDRSKLCSSMWHIVVCLGGVKGQRWWSSNK